MLASLGSRMKSLRSPGPLYTRIFVVGLVLLSIIVFVRYSPMIPNVRLAATRTSRTRNLLDDVLNRTLGFEKIFVVNLPHRTDRRDAMSLGAHYTALDFEYVEGVVDVSEKALPPKGAALNLSTGGLGCWRAHMNIFRKMVENNIQSALILEDDADWDIHIKTQMYSFAKASQLLVQPLQGTLNTSIDPSYPKPQEGQEYVDFDLSVFDDHPTTPATSSPYGDLARWDLLWVGHCGKALPFATDRNVPIGRVVISEDQTVPSQAHFAKEASDGRLMEQYPPLTRIVSRAWSETCTSGYAVSLPGAKRLLYELGVWQMTGYYDMQLRSMCQGHEGRENAAVCISPMPQYFNHHLPAGDMSLLSDISDPSEKVGYIDKPFTPNIRWSTRVNLPRFIEGRTDWIDSFE